MSTLSYSWPGAIQPFGRYPGAIQTLGLVERQDDFNRADQFGLGFPSDGGTRWVDELPNPLRIVGNQVAPDTGGGFRGSLLKSRLSDGVIKATVAALSGGFGLAFRAVDVSNRLLTFYSVGSGQWEVWKQIAGVYTSLATNTTAGLSVSDEVWITLNGTSIDFSKNGAAPFMSITESTHLTAIYHGVQLYADQNDRIENFSITALGAGSTPIAVSDSLDITLTESFGADADIVVTDAFDITLTEISGVVVVLSLSDGLNVTLTETITSSFSLSISDSLDLTLTESLASNAFMSVTDTLSITLIEVYGGSLWLSVSDSLDITLTENFVALGPVLISVSDSLDISFVESFGIVDNPIIPWAGSNSVVGFTDPSVHGFSDISITGFSSPSTLGFFGE